MRKLVDPVLLGYPDGEQSQNDSKDPYVNKLGGVPSWLKIGEREIKPDVKKASCDSCTQPMVLLLQIFAPIEDSPFDRFIYVWGCNKKECSVANGSFKVLRGQLINNDYLRKLQVKRKNSKPKKKMDSNSKSKSANPLDSTKKLDFTTIWGAKNVQASVLGNATSSTDKKSISSFIFSPPSQSTVFSGNSVDVFGAKPISQEKKIEDELQELRIQDGNKNVMGSEKVGEWPTIIPHATSLYLDTEEEAFNGSNFEDIPGKKKSSTNPVEDVSLKNDKDEKWEGEKYENSKLPRGMDEAMVKFMSIFGKNPEQVVRYQFGGVPLFYTLKDKTAKTLITETVENVTQRSNLPGNTLTEVEEQSTVYSDEDSDEDIKINSYSTKKLPKCPLCKGPRTFELQVMPSLISVLKLDGLSMPDAPKNPKAEHGMKNTVFHSSGIGMEFGTILVFSCQRNCHNGKYGGNLIDALDTDPAVKDVIYHEELVLIQSELD